jgi:hypothetical protein
MNSIYSILLQLENKITRLNEKSTFTFNVPSPANGAMEVHQDPNFGHQGNGTYKIYKKNKPTDLVLEKSTAPFNANYNFSFPSAGDYVLEIHQYGGSIEFPVRTKELIITNASNVPLKIISPSEGETTGKNISVRGFSQPGTGTVRVSVGSGASKEATIGDDAHWSVDVESNESGNQRIVALNRVTNESVQRVINIEQSTVGLTRLVRAPSGFYLEGFGTENTVLQTSPNSNGPWTKLKTSEELNVPCAGLTWQGASWSYTGPLASFSGRIYIKQEQDMIGSEYNYPVPFIPYRHPELTYPQDGQTITSDFSFSGIGFPDPGLTMAKSVIILDSNGFLLGKYDFNEKPTDVCGLQWAIDLTFLPPGENVLTIKHERLTGTPERLPQEELIVTFFVE